jgi:hypothetical protein
MTGRSATHLWSSYRDGMLKQQALYSLARHMALQCNISLSLATQMHECTAVSGVYADDAG